MAITRAEARKLVAGLDRPGGAERLAQALDEAAAADNAAYLAAHPEVRERRERLAAMSPDERRAEVARLDGTLAREGRLLTAEELQWRRELLAQGGR
jgi:hypothetical protein